VDRQFASDNYAGAHPNVLAAVAAANEGHAISYGDDEWTARAVERFREELGDVEVAIVFNGTGANVVGLGQMLAPHEAVICAGSAHINVDEGGAPERFLGCKLIDVPAPGGKLSPEQVAERLTGIGDEHRVQPRVVSVSQSTELGTVYSLGELAALADLCHEHGLLLHVDGSRIANAAVSQGATLREATGDLGVDVLSFGGTKNGLLGAEAVVFFDRGCAEGYRYTRKRSMQLGSKMRFLAVQLEALLTDGLWHANAAHANAMAARLAAAVDDLPGLTIAHPVQANAVFAQLPRAAAERVLERHRFYFWDERESIVRWMCSWDTTAEDVDTFAADVRDALTASAARAAVT
jgi:threonine aldolase